VARRGIVALADGCVVQAAGLAALALLIGTFGHPAMAALMVPLVLFGYGQGMVLAPLFSVVLTNVRHAYAGAGSGILTTTQQVANGVGVVVVGALYFVVQNAHGDRWALLVASAGLACTIVATISFLYRMRPRAAPVAVPSA
jgi:sugar phosphate permease